MFSINYGDSEREYLEHKLDQLDITKVLVAKTGGIIESVITTSYPDDLYITNTKSIAQLKKEYPKSIDEINYVYELIKDPNSNFNKKLKKYKNFLISYDKFPKLFKLTFSISDLFDDVYNEGIYDDISDECWDLLDEYIFNKSGYYTIIRSLGFDGPDDDTILSVFRDIDHDTLKIYGKFRFCVYGGTKKDFNKLLKELDGYTHDINGVQFTIEDTEQAADTYGISMNAIQNTDDTRWISAKYILTYKF